MLIGRVFAPLRFSGVLDHENECCVLKDKESMKKVAIEFHFKGL